MKTHPFSIVAKIANTMNNCGDLAGDVREFVNVFREFVAQHYKHEEFGFDRFLSTPMVFAIHLTNSRLSQSSWITSGSLRPIGQKPRQLFIS